MNEVIENILSRRSVRAFSEKKIAEEDLRTLVKCALYAPNARNLQTWRFTVLTKRDDIDELASEIEKALDRTGYDMYRPAALIIPSNSADSPYGRDDNACALENIFLAAHSMEMCIRDRRRDRLQRTIRRNWILAAGSLILAVAAYFIFK